MQASNHDAGHPVVLILMGNVSLPGSRREIRSWSASSRQAVGTANSIGRTRKPLSLHANNYNSFGSRDLEG